jgi:3-methylfumaryl-CoA hydratase
MRYVGRQRDAEDVVDAQRMAAFAAALDRCMDWPADGTELPPCWHWMLFRPIYSASRSGEDGHERLGEFLPDAGLPRRMWAGGRVRVGRPLQVGEAVRQHSVISDVQEKQGRSGRLLFVTVRHHIEGDRGGNILDEQDIVYRERAATVSATAAAAVPPSPPSDWARHWRPDPALLFRYSALTYNSHRIHYDRDFCIRVEGYPGLVVHGPLLATLLALLAADNTGARITSFDYRSRAPVFDNMSFTTRGRREGGHATLWAERPDRSVAIEATATLRDTT